MDAYQWAYACGCVGVKVFGRVTESFCVSQKQTSAAFSAHIWLCT